MDMLARVRRYIDALAQRRGRTGEGDAHTEWLRRNAQERMDANRTDLFDAVRARFHQARYSLAARYVSDRIVLDVASGTGYGAGMLAREGGARTVYGLELDLDAVRYAVATYAASGIRFLQGSITDMPFRDGMFDCVTCFETLEHVPDEDRMLHEVHRVLKPGGLLIASTPNAWGATDHPYHVRDYTHESLSRSLGRFFIVETLFNQNSGCMGLVTNHGQAAGIVPTDDGNRDLAECFIVVARRAVS